MKRVKNEKNEQKKHYRPTLIANNLKGTVNKVIAHLQLRPGTKTGDNQTTPYIVGSCGSY